MSDKHGNAAGPGIDVAEILYTVFRHKWLILSVSIVTIGATAAIWFLRHPAYQSEARLYIRYVVESQSPAQNAPNDSRIRSPDARGDSIINTELQILTSWDIAKQVVATVGAEKIVGKTGLPSPETRATALIQKGLKVEVPRNSSVVMLTFEHQNPEIAQSVLKTVITSYFKMHAEFHAVGAFDEFLVKETDQRRARVVALEGELRAAKSKLGIFSLNDTRLALATQMASLQQQLVNAEADLAQERATLGELAKNLPAGSGVVTNGAGITNVVVEPVPNAKTDEYKKLCALIDSLGRREQELLLTFTPSNSLVKYVQEQLAKNQEQKRQLETAHPGLLATPLPQGQSAPTVAEADPRPSYNLQLARVTGLESRLKTLKQQFADSQKRIADLTAGEGNITDLERSLLLEQTNYTRFAQSLDQAQINEKLGAGKVSNISVIQEPTPAFIAPSKLPKIMVVVLLGGIAAAFGLAFLLEMYLDSSVKRPADVENRLGLPLFLSIPMLAANGGGSNRKNGSNGRLLAAHNNSDNHSPGEPIPSSAALAPWDASHGLRPFSEALRDRLMTYFEVNNMTHNPKLVAITSCGEGAGVSTVAAGLAASLSETGEGNVLLVDMNVQNGAAHHFHRGDLACGLDQALESGTRAPALVQENLYVVSEGENVQRLPSVLPSRFKSLVPKLKASDYDYIIFDMPPVSQVSLTPRLARFMDMTLMVIESEQTDREVVRKASKLFEQAEAKIGVVLNKHRRYVPQTLTQEL